MTPDWPLTHPGKLKFSARALMPLFSFPVIWIKTERGGNRATGLSENLTTPLSMTAALSNPLDTIPPLLPKPSAQFFIAQEKL